MYTRILVPLDGSDLAAQALPYARLIGKSINAEVELFRAVPPLIDFLKQTPPTAAGDVDEGGSPMLTATAGGTAWEERYEQAKQGIRSEMETMAASLRSAGLAARVELGEGDAAEATVQEANRLPDTLIVMTTHGRSGFLRIWGGSVMDKILHLTSTPALVVRSRENGQAAPREPQVQRIIVPLDGSALSEEAVPHAIALAKGLDASIEVLQAFSKAGVAVAPGADDAARAGIGGSGDVTAYLDSMVERIRLGGVRRVEGTPAQGDAGNAIIEAAEHTPDSMVVMSTHGRSGLGRLLRGSVADKVIRRAERPVLLVRPAQQL